MGVYSRWSTLRQYDASYKFGRPVPSSLMDQAYSEYTKIKKLIASLYQHIKSRDITDNKSLSSLS